MPPPETQPYQHPFQAPLKPTKKAPPRRALRELNLSIQPANKPPISPVISPPPSKPALVSQASLPQPNKVVQKDGLVGPTVKLVEEAVDCQKSFLRLIGDKGRKVGRLEALKSAHSFQLSSLNRSLALTSSNPSLVSTMQAKEAVSQIRSLKTPGESGILADKQARGLLNQEIRKGKKVTVELMPNMYPPELKKEEEELCARIKKTVEQVEGLKLADDLEFIKDGLSVPEALAFVQQVSSKIQDPKVLKEMVVKIDRNLNSIADLKYLTTDDKIGEEELEQIKQIGHIWGFFKKISEHSQLVDEAGIFFNLMVSLKAKMKFFEESLPSVDESIKSLEAKNDAMKKTISESKTKLKADFVTEMMKEMDEIENKLK